MPRLLITGGHGFIGSAVVEHARREGWSVRVIDTHGRDATEAVADDVEYVRGDVRDRSAVEGALEGVDAVCHLAAKVGLGVDFADAPDYASTNVVGTAELLSAMATRGIRRLVIASSMVVYGEGAYRDPDGAPARPAPRAAEMLAQGRFDPLDAQGRPLTPELLGEDATRDPRNVYAATKLAQEHLASSWARETGATAAMLRFHNVYGPGMPRDTPYAGVAALFRSALARGLAPRVFEDGRQRRDFVHVSDVARANIAALDWTAAAPAAHARPFNVGSGVVTTIGELATGLARTMGGPSPVVTGEFRLGDVRHITASSARAADELGWRAAVRLADGLREFADAAAD